MRWFTSDQHFEHDRIIRFSERPFANTQHMNLELLRRYNTLVQSTDSAWFLGDVVFKDEDEFCWPQMCNGTKTLIVGNHDRNFRKLFQPQNDEDDKHWILGEFTSVVHGNATLKLENGVTVLLCHFPYPGHVDEKDQRYHEHRPKDSGQWLLHGHVHDGWRQRGRMINVGVDAWGLSC